jgi:hypothetical protein
MLVAPGLGDRVDVDVSPKFLHQIQQKARVLEEKFIRKDLAEPAKESLSTDKLA